MMIFVMIMAERKSKATTTNAEKGEEKVTILFRTIIQIYDTVTNIHINSLVFLLFLVGDSFELVDRYIYILNAIIYTMYIFFFSK